MSRVLVVGSFCVEYIHDNWREPLQRLFDDGVICVNFLPLARYMGERKLGQYLLRVLDDNPCDALLFYPDWAATPEFLASSTMREIRRRGIKTLVFYPDDEPGTWMDRNIEKFDRYFQKIATHSRNAYQIRRARGRAETYYLPWGFNPARWYPVAADSYDTDILFIGKNKMSGTSATEVEDGALRDRFLLHIRDLARKHGWTMRIYGYGWEHHPELRECWGGALDIEDIPRIVGRSKIVLNPAWAFHKDAPTVALPQLKLRHFEFYGCGALQVTNTNPELYDLLGETDLVRYVERLDDIEPTLVEVIAARSVPHLPLGAALQAHTIDNRIATMLRQAGISVVRLTHGTVRLVYHRAAQDEAEIIRQIDALRASDQGITHLCFVDQGRFSCRFETALLSPGRLAPDRLYRFFFKVDYSRFQANHLHNLDADGRLLVACIDDWVDFSTAHLKDGSPARDLFSAVAIGPTCQALEGLLIPIGQAAALFRTYRRQGAFPGPTPEIFPFYVSELIPRIASGAVYIPWLLNSADKLLLRLFRLCRAHHLTVTLYGVAGMLGQRALNLAEEHDFEFTSLIDNGNVGKGFRGRMIAGHRQLEDHPTDIVVVSAEVSGPAIIRNIENSKIASTILPLHRVSSPLWKAFFAIYGRRKHTPSDDLVDDIRTAPLMVAAG